MSPSSASRIVARRRTPGRSPCSARTARAAPNACCSRSSTAPRSPRVISRTRMRAELRTSASASVSATTAVNARVSSFPPTSAVDLPSAIAPSTAVRSAPPRSAPPDVVEQQAEREQRRGGIADAVAPRCRARCRRRDRTSPRSISPLPRRTRSCRSRRCRGSRPARTPCPTGSRRTRSAPARPGSRSASGSPWRAARRRAPRGGARRGSSAATSRTIASKKPSVARWIVCFDDEVTESRLRRAYSNAKRAASVHGPPLDDAQRDRDVLADPLPRIVVGAAGRRRARSRARRSP